MDSENLYRVQREDLPKLEKLLNLCFAHDPLYETLIPNAEIRKKLMPELFHCDMDEFYETCEIFSDSEELNSVLVVSDETKSCNIFRFLYTEAKAVLHTDSFLIKEDPSLHTFYNFIKGGDYLNSNWTDQLHQNRRLHVIYLAVNPQTHNQNNVEFYQKFGFKVYGVLEKNFSLKQYCMIREVR